MGVPKFNRYLRDKSFPGVLIRRKPPHVSSLLFDLNGLLHKSAQQTYGYGEWASQMMKDEIYP